ncbi:MAG TPA: YbfB/YjiJ family MFS transporter, partial [Rhodocyclaceae bacterium]|nr:YbfB/YjiJ family MFS transporter [Rhodocyclaceae bacterium]
MRDRNDSLALTTAIGGLVALAIAMGIGRFAFTPILPMMQADGVLSLREGGWLASANYLGYLVGALLAGRRGGGPRALLRNGLVLVVVTTASMGALASLPWWLVARFVAGVASAWVLVGTAALSLARLNEIGRPRLSGLVFAGVGAGTALAGLACQLIASLGGGATAAWWALAIVAGAGIAFVWRGVGAAAAVDDVVAAVGTPAASDPG